LALYVFSWSFTAASMLLTTTNNSRFMHSKWTCIWTYYYHY
jgi:hypothetical protein